MAYEEFGLKVMSLYISVVVFFELEAALFLFFILFCPTLAILLLLLRIFYLEAFLYFLLLDRFRHCLIYIFFDLLPLYILILLAPRVIH